MRWWPALLPFLLLWAGCGSLNPRGVPDVKDLACAHILVATPTEGRLADALSRAQAGDCVVVEGGTYRGSFTVETDVSLVADQGAEVDLVGDVANAPALRIKGGERTLIRELRVVSASSVGILIDPGPARLVSVRVQKATQGALVAECTDPSCQSEHPVSTLEGVELTQSGIGLWVDGARLLMEGGRTADHDSQYLAYGHGVVAMRGAWLTLRGVTVENNGAVGVLADGAATLLRLENTTVRGNRERGIWGQGLRGTAASPSLVVTGEGTLIDQNRLVGLGVRDSTGVQVSGATIQGTVAVNVPVGLATTEPVGDGLGLFEQSAQVQVEAVTFRANARSQVLIDRGGSDISLRDVTMDGGQFSTVVQNTSSPVDVAPALLSSPGRVLPVRADEVPPPN